MDHCAIDVGGRKSQICIRDSSGTIRFEGALETAGLGDHLRQLPHCRVILETAAESFRIADQARSAGHEVRVVPATLVRTLGVGARSTKTGKRDARALSEVSTRVDLPSVPIPSARSREWKTMAGVHDALVSCRTKLINNVRGWLRGQARKLRGGEAATFTERVRTLGELPICIASELTVIDALTSEINASEKRFATLAKADPVCKRLMTVPGVGAVDGAAFRRRPRCGRAFRQRPQGRGLSRALAGGEIELRTSTAPRHHQSWIQLGQVGADSSGLDLENLLPHSRSEKAAALGGGGGETQGEGGCHRGAGAQARWNPLRALA